MNLCAARVSSQSLVRTLICSLTEGNLVFSNESGIVIGIVLKMSSNGVLVLSECLQLLWENSIDLIVLYHVSGCEEQ